MGVTCTGTRGIWGCVVVHVGVGYISVTCMCGGATGMCMTEACGGGVCVVEWRAVYV